MKKLAIILLFGIILGLFAQSCRSTKPPCPAYQAQINNTSTNPISR